MGQRTGVSQVTQDLWNEFTTHSDIKDGPPVEIKQSATNKNDTAGKAVEELLRSNNIYTTKYINTHIHDSFSRFGFLAPDNYVSHTKEYLFFVKPDLHLFDPSTDYSKVSSKTLNSELKSYPIFSHAADNYKDVMLQMQILPTSEFSLSPFIPLLSNTVNSELDLPGISAEYLDTGKNIYGAYTTYRQTSIKSDIDFDFSLEFIDTRRLDVYMFFKLYDEYERLKFSGGVTPPREDYITNRIVHDQMAVYKIVVAEDGETILYWAKLVGVYPTNVPRDAMANIDDPILNFTINFKSAFVEDMNPEILSDFNRSTQLRKKHLKEAVPLYDSKNLRMDGSWCKKPFIIKETVDNAKYKYVYKLKWRGRVS